jgi:hypothetical protein
MEIAKRADCLVGASLPFATRLNHLEIDPVAKHAPTSPKVQIPLPSSAMRSPDISALATTINVGFNMMRCKQNWLACWRRKISVAVDH